jgi:nucleoside-diphosphate-sugar epimerase
MTQRILFTGGTGKAGRHVLPWLLGKGYRILNFDLQPFDHAGIPTLVGDITDSGQVMNAMTTHFSFAGLENGAPPAPVDAVVHFAAVPRILINPDNETFRVNVMGTYNVIEAAMKLGIRKVVIASSETTYGVCFAEGKKDFHHFPLEEDYDVDPMDSYGLSKVVNEKTARSFAARYKADIYALRIGNVIEPNEYDRFPAYVADPPSRKRNAWSYIDARDLGQIVHLCLQKNGLGFEVFNAVNDTITADGPTSEFLARWCPGVPVRRPLQGDEAPLSNRKIREVLGFKE